MKRYIKAKVEYDEYSGFVTPEMYSDDMKSFRSYSPFKEDGGNFDHWYELHDKLYKTGIDDKYEDWMERERRASNSKFYSLLEKAMDVYNPEHIYDLDLLYTAHDAAGLTYQGYDAINQKFGKTQIKMLARAAKNGLDIDEIFNPSIPYRKMRDWIQDQLRTDLKLPKSYDSISEDRVTDVKKAVDILRKVAHDWYYAYGNGVRGGWDCRTVGKKHSMTLEIARKKPTNVLIDQGVVDDILDEASEKSGYPREYFSWRTTGASADSLYGYLKLKVEVPKETK